MQLLKKLLSNETKFSIKLWLHRFKKSNHFSEFEIDTSKNQAYIFLAADYGNLGDVAITYSQMEFIQNNSNYHVVLLPVSRFKDGFWFVKKRIKKNDLITIVGGGNMGDSYDLFETYRQTVIRSFTKNKIISFPQTLDFSKSEKGVKLLKKAIYTYNKHPDFVIVAREELSYNLMLNYFKANTVFLVPDIVFYLNKNITIETRKDALVCLRKDKERSLTDNDELLILKSIKKYGLKHHGIDTLIMGDKFQIENLFFELEQLLLKFKNSKLVVTDRLHGMIFCYITNTPCIVLPNNNHKIAESFKWIKDSNIQFLKEFNQTDFEKAIVNANMPKRYKSLKGEFESLIKELSI